MDKDNSSSRTLRRASDRVGSQERLASLLGVTPAELNRWISGEELPPHGVFIRALELALIAAEHPERDLTRNDIRVMALKPGDKDAR